MWRTRGTDPLDTKTPPQSPLLRALPEPSQRPRCLCLDISASIPGTLALGLLLGQEPSSSSLLTVLPCSDSPLCLEFTSYKLRLPNLNLQATSFADLTDLDIQLPLCLLPGCLHSTQAYKSRIGFFLSCRWHLSSSPLHSLH